MNREESTEQGLLSFGVGTSRPHISHASGSGDEPSPPRSFGFMPRPLERVILLALLGGIVLALACLAGTPALAAAATDVVPSAPQDELSTHAAAPAVWDQTSAYREQQLEGWRVLVNQKLVADKALCAATLTLLSRQLQQITGVVPKEPLTKLREIPIWVERSSSQFPCMCYHESRAWLETHGVNPDKTGAVELANPTNFLTWTRQQPWMVLHELAHGYHQRFLGENHEGIERCYERAKAARIYDSVLRNNGRHESHYALTNVKEYFAEMTEAFFGTNDFYPFVRAELRDYDPPMFAVLGEVWGVTNALDRESPLRLAAVGAGPDLIPDQALRKSEQQPIAAHVPVGTDFHAWAPTPPMGWNSWDCFATTITEAQTKAQAEVMAQKLARYGWQYVVVDIQWYEPQATGFEYRKGAQLSMDEWGRLLPATNRFPAGFATLAQYIHSKSLKFGIHLMRGIPRLAVAQNLRVKGSSLHAAEIADTNSVCLWNTDMYGVDTTKPGAQEYYNSVFELIASWGVDFVKVDDLSRPYHQGEIEAIRKAIDRAGRPMVLSTSPGATPLSAGEHVLQHANMWRVSDDFWDKWPELLAQFQRLRDWTPYRGPGHFPDADMLPLGVIEIGKRTTHFTRDEQCTLMTLWCIARSPLILGADLTRLDDFTLSLLTNEEVLAVNQRSTGNHELFNRDGLIAWVAEAPGSNDKYVALFNTRDVPAKVAVPLSGPAQVRDLWQRKDLGKAEGEFSTELSSHGAKLLRVSPGSLKERAAAPNLR